MPIYTAPVRDTLFLLREVFGAELTTLFGDRIDPAGDLAHQIVDAAGQFAAEVVAPLNGPGDVQGCTFRPDGSVAMPDGYKEAYRRFHADGWGGIALPEAYGGQALPAVLAGVVKEFICSGSPAFAMSAGGPAAMFEVLVRVASPEIAAIYLPKLASGEWTGTMNLTEPHCGSDVGLIRTRAQPQPDGTYRVTGDKIFISGGEHDCTANIVHLVLARTPDAPPSTRGLSLFLVPKFLVNADGTLGERNTVSCTAVEHKMGLRASPTCAMRYEGATGWLLGEENRGLAAMFLLMNSARIGVGIQALAAAELAYQNALAYALERRQGRSVSGPVDPHEAADPIIVHPDVRRMLMDARAFIEPMRALVMWCGLLIDRSRHEADAAGRELAEVQLALLTPILKGYGSERALRVTLDMQQIWGGHGYIVGNGMEQFVRDCRIAAIYEGATGIQAWDLVGRKIRANGGSGLEALLSSIEQEASALQTASALAPIAEAVTRSATHLRAATRALADRTDEERAAASFNYLQLAGLVVFGLMWLRICGAAERNRSEGDADIPGYYAAKLATGLHFAQQALPETLALLEKIEAGGAPMMAMADPVFCTG